MTAPLVDHWYVHTSLCQGCRWRLDARGRITCPRLVDLARVLMKWNRLGSHGRLELHGCSDYRGGGGTGSP